MSQYLVAVVATALIFLNYSAAGQLAQATAGETATSPNDANRP